MTSWVCVACLVSHRWPVTQTGTELSYPGQAQCSEPGNCPFPFLWSSVSLCIVPSARNPRSLQGGWDKIALNYFTGGYWNSAHKIPKLRLYKQTYNNSSTSPFWSAWSTTLCMYSNNWVSFLDEFCLEIHMHHQHFAVTVSSGLSAQVCGPEDLTIIFTSTNALAKRHFTVSVEEGFISLN